MLQDRQERPIPWESRPKSHRLPPLRRSLQHVRLQLRLVRLHLLAKIRRDLPPQRRPSAGNLGPDDLVGTVRHDRPAMALQPRQAHRRVERSRRRTRAGTAMDLRSHILQRQLAGSQLVQPAAQRHSRIPARLLVGPHLHPRHHQQRQVQTVLAAVPQQAPHPGPTCTGNRLGRRGHQLGRQISGHRKNRRGRRGRDRGRGGDD